MISVRLVCRINEHIERFQQGGRYYKWITSGEIKGVCYPGFSDIHASEGHKYGYIFPLRLMNANRLDGVPFLYYIVFTNDCTSYQTYTQV